MELTFALVFVAGIAAGMLCALGIWLTSDCRGCPGPKLYGGGIMYVVSATNPDVGYVITPPDKVVDAEGNKVPVGDLVFSIASDNVGAVEVIPSPENILVGTVKFGAPNEDGTPAMANINVTVSASDGTLLGSYGAQFTVPAGPAVAIQGGGISFEGLTEQS